MVRKHAAGREPAEKEELQSDSAAHVLPRLHRVQTRNTSARVDIYVNACAGIACLYSMKSWQHVRSTVGLELLLLGRFSAGGMFADHLLISSSHWPIDDHGDEGHIVQRVTAWERHMVWELGPC